MWSYLGAAHTDRGDTNLVHPAPLRVGLDAHVVGRRQTGNETYLIELASALARRDDVRPIAYVDRGMLWPHPQGPLVSRLRWRSRYIRIPFELPVRGALDRVSLLHVQYVAPPVSPVPVVAVIHDLSFVDIPEDLPRAMVLRMRAMVGWTVRLAPVVMAVSEFTRERVIDHYGLSPDRVVVTPNGVSGKWRPLEAEERCARLTAGGLAGLPERFVLAVGTRHTRKNLDRLVRVVAAIRASGDPDVGLVLAGPSGTGAAAIRSEVVRLRAGSWVRSVGYVPDEVLIALVGAASAVAYPSRYEGFGLPILEAMACGAVVVAADLPSISEVARDGVILVDPESDDSMAAALSAALTDRDVRARLTDAGPAIAATFDWDRCAAATVDAYRRALSS